MSALSGAEAHPAAPPPARIPPEGALRLPISVWALTVLDQPAPSHAGDPGIDPVRRAVECCSEGAFERLPTLRRDMDRADLVQKPKRIRFGLHISIELSR